MSCLEKREGSFRTTLIQRKCKTELRSLVIFAPQKSAVFSVSFSLFSCNVEQCDVHMTKTVQTRSNPFNLLVLILSLKSLIKNTFE